MTTHLGTYLRPTLAELTAGWSSYGISPAKAVRELVALHLARTNAKGKGNRALRRMQRLKSVTMVWRGDNNRAYGGVLTGERLNAQGLPVQPGECTERWVIHGTGLT